MSTETVETTLASQPPASKPARSFLGHAKLIGGFTFLSRIMGLAREVVAGHYLGTGLVASAFTVAFTIPNLFRKLFGEGALSAAFIPLYAQEVKREEEGTKALRHAGTLLRHEGTEGGEADGGRRELGIANCKLQIANCETDSGSSRNSSLRASVPSCLRASPSHASTANDFAAASVNLLCLVLIVLTLIGEAILAFCIWREPGMRPDRLLMFRLTEIMLPYVLLICGTAFLGAILQVHHRFAAPAAAPILLNVCHILVVFIGARLLHLRQSTDPDKVVALQTTLAYWLSFFVLIAGVMQFSILLPGLRAVGFRFKLVLHFWTPAIRKMLKLSIPVAMGAGVLQLSVLLDKGISVALMSGRDTSGHLIDHFTLLGHLYRYPMEAGAPARLNLAQFLYQFPLGVFAIALATAIFPGLSADAMDKDRTRFKSVIRQGVEATLWEGIPASAGLILIRTPAVKLLFQHGLVTAHDAALISQSVLYYSGAIWAFSLLQILNRAYFAMHDTMTPLVMSVMNIVVNLVVELPLVWFLGEAGMAVGTLVSFAIQAVLTLYLLDQRVGGLGLGRIFQPVVKMCLATIVMCLVLLGLQRLPIYPHANHRMDWMIQLFVLMIFGAGVYLGMCKVMGVETMQQLMPGSGRKTQDVARSVV
jgi:putative peptidoglycan lipid II flippase